MIRVGIVDDEPHARAALRILCARRRGVEVAVECRDGAEALEVLRWTTVDLLLLDIQMPGVDGFGVLHALGARMPPTVFVTAFDEYALRAFEVGAVDYVLKPFDERRFLAAFDRACARVAERRGARWARRLLAATPERAMPAAPQPERLAIPVSSSSASSSGSSPGSSRIVFVPFDDIDWIEAADQYVIVHAGEKAHLLRESLQRLARRLPPHRFAQIHRSHLVNLAKIQEVTRLTKGDAQVTLANGRQLRLSRRFRHALRPMLTGLRAQG